jgi:hypothetical protein
MSLPPLIKPLDYLRIRHPEKRRYDSWLPFALSALSILGLAVLPLPVQILGDGGLLSIFTEFLPVLFGFYIAALAAIATFDRQGMDDPMPGQAPEMWVTFHGKRESVPLTRRRFLCYMFGYLALMSFALFAISAVGNWLAPNIHALVPYDAKAFLYVRWGFLGVFLFLASNLLVTTLLGLYYMTDRIHRLDGKVVIKPRE